MPPSPVRHKLLARQVRRLLGGTASGGLSPFLDAVEAAYRQADDDRAMLERSLELTSQELLEQNARLREELAHREAAEESLRRSVVRLDEAQRVARLGYWEMDIETRQVFWSAQTYRIFGFEPGAVTPSFGLFAGMVRPETLDEIAAAVAGTWGRETREITFSITRADGAGRVLRASGEVVRGGDGGVTQVHGVCVDVTAEEEQKRELVRAKERAEEMLRLKSSFLDNMSHEIRTPLTGILGYAEILADEVADADRDLVEAIVRGGRRLMDTLNSVLDLAQIESGSFALAPVGIDVRAEAAEVLALLDPLARAKGIRLALAPGPEAVWARADRAALFRVFNNVVGNAVKFTEAGGVTVSVETAGGVVRVRVRDTGPGIDPAFVPHLFDEFRQASNGHDRRHEGNGLGLTITKRLVEMMDGAVGVESAPGEGTVFEVTLPAAEAPAMPVAA